MYSHDKSWAAIVYCIMEETKTQLAFKEKSAGLFHPSTSLSRDYIRL